MRSRALVVVLLIAGCGAAPASPSSTPSVAASTLATMPATTTMVETSSTTAAAATTTTTTVPFRELTITGTGKVYTLEESQAFGEFGPLLWNLVTTLNGTNRIEHGPGHEWVIWGPMWGGRIDDGMTWRDTYGVTDLGAVDPAMVAAAVPTGDVIFLREVRWSLDRLDDYGAQLWEVALELEPKLCRPDSQLQPGEGLLVRATPKQVFEVVREWARLGLPLDVLSFELRDECLVSWYWPAPDPPFWMPPGALVPN